MLLEIIFFAVLFAVLWLIGRDHGWLQIFAFFGLCYIGQTLYEWRARWRADRKYWAGE